MPSSNAGLLINLLGSFIGDQSPQRNPRFKGVDANGQFIDGETPYVTPGFGTKFFHPDVAAQEGAYNNQPFQAKLQNTIVNNIGADNTRVARGGFGKKIEQMTDQELGLLSNNNPTANSLYGVSTASANQAAELPTAQATFSANELKEKNRATLANLKNNLPEAQSAAELAQANYRKPMFETEGLKLKPQLNYDLANIASQQRMLQPRENATVAQANFSTAQDTANMELIHPTVEQKKQQMKNDALRLENEYNELIVNSLLSKENKDRLIAENRSAYARAQLGATLDEDKLKHASDYVSIQDQERSLAGKENSSKGSEYDKKAAIDDMIKAATSKGKGGLPKFVDKKTKQPVGTSAIPTTAPGSTNSAAVPTNKPTIATLPSNDPYDSDTYAQPINSAGKFNVSGYPGYTFDENGNFYFQGKLVNVTKNSPIYKAVHNIQSPLGKLPPRTY
jgi:hypothetical protein